jgi:hypothetical protein
LSRILTPGEKDLKELEQAPGGYNRLLVPRYGPRLVILALYVNAIIEVELEFCLIIYS